MQLKVCNQNTCNITNKFFEIIEITRNSRLNDLLRLSLYRGNTKRIFWTVSRIKIKILLTEMLQDILLSLEHCLKYNANIFAFTSLKKLEVLWSYPTPSIKNSSLVPYHWDNQLYICVDFYYNFERISKIKCNTYFHIFWDLYSSDIQDNIVHQILKKSKVHFS